MCLGPRSACIAARVFQNVGYEPQVCYKGLDNAPQDPSSMPVSGWLNTLCYQGVGQQRSTNGLLPLFIPSCAQAVYGCGRTHPCTRSEAFGVDTEAGHCLGMARRC